MIATYFAALSSGSVTTICVTWCNLVIGSDLLMDFMTSMNSAGLQTGAVKGVNFSVVFISGGAKMSAT